MMSTLTGGGESTVWLSRRAIMTLDHGAPDTIEPRPCTPPKSKTWFFRFVLEHRNAGPGAHA